MKKLIVVLMILMPTVLTSVFAQTELEFQTAANENYFHGVTQEYVNGVYPDILTYDGEKCVLAIEVDFSSKWAEGISQALLYAAYTRGRACLLLIKSDVSDNTFMNHVNRALVVIVENRLPIDIYVINLYYEIGLLWKSPYVSEY